MLLPTLDPSPRVKHSYLVSILIGYVIYARLWILSLLPAVAAGFFVDIEILKVWVTWFFILFIPPALLITPIGFIPRCPGCGKRIAVIPLKGRHENWPPPKGFINGWFGELVRYQKTHEVPCHHCGGKFRL